MHNLARFEQLSHAQCPAGPSDLVHFVVKLSSNSEFREDFYAGDFLMVHQF